MFHIFTGEICVRHMPEPQTVLDVQVVTGDGLVDGHFRIAAEGARSMRLACIAGVRCRPRNGCVRSGQTIRAWRHGKP